MSHMIFETFSHRHAEAIIMSDPILKNRYCEFINVISSITDDDLIKDFLIKKAEHSERNTAFKSLTPSINSLLKDRLTRIDGWKSEVDIFNDTKGVLGNTEWRLDFACDNTFCVEVAFNHGEAIAWNLLKPVLSCELNHVKKAIQGQIGIYVCATDLMKVIANIDSASGSYEKVLRYLPPMMNQLTIPMMIIGLKPSGNFKISKEEKEVIHRIDPIDNPITKEWVNKKVIITKNDYTTLMGKVVDVVPSDKIVIKNRNKNVDLQEQDIRFIEIYKSK